MQSRIDRLEGLVLSLMSGNSNNVSPRARDARSSSSGGGAASYTESRDGDAEDDDDAMGYDEHDGNHGNHVRREKTVEEDVEEVRNALGVMKVMGGKTYYRGETHWAAILSEITEVKKYFDETKQKYENELATMRCQSTIAKLQTAGFPFSAGPPPTKQEILNLVPKQAMVDQLVDCYFRNHDPLFHVLHRPSFYKQYEDFWRNPSKVDILWLGLLMVIMSISVKIQNHVGGQSMEIEGLDTVEMHHAYRTAAEQCLIIGEYTKKLYLHTIQTLILLATSGPEENGWLFMGMVIRLAMSMGLHRDPRNFPAITQGEGEMRRRLWTMITCIDLLSSIQIGLPTMIKKDECDTKLPLNLHDDEIGENVTTLPPERGGDQLTGVCYMIWKATMAHTLWEVIQQVNSVHARPVYDVVLKLEAEINERYSRVPAFLHIKTIEESVHDPAWLIIQRYNLDILRHLALLTLHRPYAAKARLNPRFMHSYRQCVSSAVTLLKHQDDIFTQSETTLRHARWYTDTQGTQEFLRAAMIVCMHLSCPQGDDALNPEDRKRKFEALLRAREITEKLRGDSLESQKVHGVISVMIEKLKRDEPVHAERMRKRAEQLQHTQQPQTPLSAFDRRVAAYSNSSGPDLSATSSTQAVPAEPLRSEQAAAMTLGMMSGGGLTPNSAFATLYDRPVVSTPGGTLNLPDATSVEAQPLSPPASGLSPPGWNTLWGSSMGGFELPQGSDWDEWDSFMKGIDLDSSQLGGFPVLPGIGSYPMQQERK